MINQLWVRRRGPQFNKTIDLWGINMLIGIMSMYVLQKYKGICLSFSRRRGIKHIDLDLKSQKLWGHAFINISTIITSFFSYFYNNYFKELDFVQNSIKLINLIML